MSALHDALQRGAGYPADPDPGRPTPEGPVGLLGVAGPDVPCQVIESSPGDLVVFDHRCKHAAFGGGPNRRMFTMNWSVSARAEFSFFSFFLVWSNRRVVVRCFWRVRTD